MFFSANTRFLPHFLYSWIYVLKCMSSRCYYRENEISLALCILHRRNDELRDVYIPNLRAMNQCRTPLLNTRLAPECPCIDNFLRTLEHHRCRCCLSQDSLATASVSQSSHECPAVDFRGVSFINIPMRISSLICLFDVKTTRLLNF